MTFLCATLRCVRVSLFTFFVSSLTTAPLFAAEPEEKLLWPNGAPDAKGDKAEDKPSLTIHRPAADKNMGCAVVICPGGGYAQLSMDHEGHQLAKWFAERGITGAVLKYRLRAPKEDYYKYPAALRDAQRSIRLLRSMAEELKCDPKKICIFGFSAGGHLASMAGTQFDDGDANAKDTVDRQSCRPDLLMLAYPAINASGPYAHKGSVENLLGKSPDQKSLDELSSDLHVTKKTPPTFLFHTGEDKSIPPENSVIFYLALRKNKVPVELHIYERGRHGIGMATKDDVVKTWPDRLEGWLKVRGVLK